jgi:uncharacterized membrane protein
MEQSAFQVHKWWVTRAVLVLLVTALAEGAAAEFLRHPILWCTLIAGSLPLSMMIFVLLPILREQNRKS